LEIPSSPPSSSSSNASHHPSSQRLSVPPPTKTPPFRVFSCPVSNRLSEVFFPRFSQAFLLRPRQTSPLLRKWSVLWPRNFLVVFSFFLFFFVFMSHAHIFFFPCPPPPPPPPPLVVFLIFETKAPCLPPPYANQVLCSPSVLHIPSQNFQYYLPSPPFLTIEDFQISCLVTFFLCPLPHEVLFRTSTSLFDCFLTLPLPRPIK